MKIIINLKKLQCTTEADSVSVDYVDGNIVIHEPDDYTTQASSEKCVDSMDEENVTNERDVVNITNDISENTATLFKHIEHDPKQFVVIFKLLKAGYCISRIADYTGVPAWKLRKFNNGTLGVCAVLSAKGICKFPIREMPETGFRRPGDNIPIKICEECGEPIPMHELLFDAQKYYCDKCEKKLMSDISTVIERTTAVDGNVTIDGLITTDSNTKSFTDTVDSKEKPVGFGCMTHTWVGETIKLLKLGYSVNRIAKKFDVSTSVISNINQGRHVRCKEFPDEKFPIQDNKRCIGTSAHDTWRRVPVTYCKECGEPIPVADLLKDPHCEYCPDCKAKRKEE